MNSFLDRANELVDQTIGIRRSLHQIPELGFQEEKTSSFVARQLESDGIKVQKGIAKTGLLVRIEGRNQVRNGMLRVDMDALPVQEETGLEFGSKTPGRMHACGHDGHMAMGITAARMLHERSTLLNGSILCIFQPAEEGDGGAKAMIADGVLENPKPDFILGIHLWNERPVGWISIKDGPLMAGADSIEISVKGKGGHGGLPQQVKDPIVCAAQIIGALQTIVSRNLSPFDQAVLSLTAINGGTAFNVIPDQVSIKGTLRTFNAEVRKLILNRMEHIIKGTAAAYDCEAVLMDREVTSPVVNDPLISTKAREVISAKFPTLRVDKDYQTTVSEDFAFYQEKVPGCFIFLGSSNSEKGKIYSHHHPKFDFDESVLPLGAALLAEISSEMLNQPRNLDN